MFYEKNQIIKRIRDLGMRDELFMLVGVRSKANKINEFDDKFYVITSSRCMQFDCTTNPGTDWLLNLLNHKGAAVLKPDMKYYYKIGIHKDYKALVQAEPVTVYRDADKDNIAEEQGVEDTGYFGINIHRASKWGASKYIGKYSAGCQVLASSKDFDTLIKECESTNLEKFPYYLLREWPIIEKHTI